MKKVFKKFCHNIYCYFYQTKFCSRIRVWWNFLWIRKDEFHNSLNMDGSAMLTMNEKQKERYLSELVKRREIAHERGLD